MSRESQAEILIDHLGLQPHPEGGWYRETWRSEHVIPSGTLTGYPGARSAGTCIHFLLPAGERSRLHRVRSDELWIHQEGDPVRLRRHLEREGLPDEVRVGPVPGALPQALVPGGWWQEAEPEAGEHGYALLACVVVPGFEFEDFELGDAGS